MNTQAKKAVKKFLEVSRQTIPAIEGMRDGAKNAELHYLVFATDNLISVMKQYEKDFKLLLKKK